MKMECPDCGSKMKKIWMIQDGTVGYKCVKGRINEKTRERQFPVYLISQKQVKGTRTHGVAAT